MNEITGIKRHSDLLIFCLIIKKLQKLGTKIDAGDKDRFDPTACMFFCLCVYVFLDFSTDFYSVTITGFRVFADPFLYKIDDFNNHSSVAVYQHAQTCLTTS